MVEFEKVDGVFYGVLLVSGEVLCEYVVVLCR